MKKRYPIAILLCILSLGCSSQQRDFAKFTAYLNRTNPELPDATGFADKLFPLCDRPDAGIPFLKDKLGSSDHRERVAAYAALGVLVGQIQQTPTPEGLRLLDLIEPNSIHEQFSSFSPSSLSKNLQEWSAKTHKYLKKDLEKIDAEGPPTVGPRS